MAPVLSMGRASRFEDPLAYRGEKRWQRWDPELIAIHKEPIPSTPMSLAPTWEGTRIPTMSKSQLVSHSGASSPHGSGLDAT